MTIFLDDLPTTLAAVHYCFTQSLWEVANATENQKGLVRVSWGMMNFKAIFSPIAMFAHVFAHHLLPPFWSTRNRENWRNFDDARVSYWSAVARPVLKPPFFVKGRSLTHKNNDTGKACWEREVLPEILICGQGYGSLCECAEGGGPFHSLFGNMTKDRWWTLDMAYQTGKWGGCSTRSRQLLSFWQFCSRIVLGIIGILSKWLRWTMNSRSQNTSDSWYEN